MNALLVGQLLGVHTVPRQVVVLTVLASYGALFTGVLGRWAPWAIVLAALLPWIHVLLRETAWLYRRYGWLALFYLLTLSQTGHFLEHVVQLAQIHLLGLAPRHAHGVFGALDVEWVHFAWNAWVALAALLLLRPFRGNPWLAAVLVIALWHGIEHTYILGVYLQTGTAGTPGFLARGGLLAGGLPILRPHLHFLYNLIETAPLLVAFLYECRRQYALTGTPRIHQ